MNAEQVKEKGRAKRREDGREERETVANRAAAAVGAVHEKKQLGKERGSNITT